MAAIPDLRAGDTYRLKLTYPVGTVLTGYVHWLTLRLGLTGTPELLVSSTFGEHTGDAANVAYLEATPDVTHLAPGKYFYAVEAQAPTGHGRRCGIFGVSRVINAWPCF